MEEQWVYRMRAVMQFKRVCLTEEYNSSRLPPKWRSENKGAVHIVLEGFTSRTRNGIGRIIRKSITFTKGKA